MVLLFYLEPTWADFARDKAMGNDFLFNAIEKIFSEFQ